MTTKKATAGKKSSKTADATLTIRCSPAWRAWVEGAARHCRTDVSKLVDGALIDYMKGRGFGEVAPDR